MEESAEKNNDKRYENTRQAGKMTTDATHLKMAREEVREGKALLKAIFDAFDGSIYASSAEFEILYMNQQLIARIGRNASGERCYEALHGRRQICPFCVMDQVQQGQNVDFEILNPGDNHWYHSVNSPIRHVDETISLLALVTDINDRKRAEEALRESANFLRKENLLLRSHIQERHKFGDIVGKSRVMQRVYEQIVNAAASDATVIIYGEPGTGKELVAHAVHDMSDRRDNRFVPVHCGAIPDNLIESEFFGYKKGAFSGASGDKEGYIGFAKGGTLFMDEVGEIGRHMQVKLLRVIEGGGYTPVGSSQVKQSNVRIIAATNRDLKELVASGAMREDFFYRVHIIPIHLPPLRERKEDLPLLVDHFLRLYCGKQNLPPVTDTFMETLQTYNWPGNVRELQNVIIRFCSLKKLDLSDGATHRACVPENLPLPALDGSGEDLRERMNTHERKLILDALERYQWRRSEVARRLGIDRKTLFTKIKQLKIEKKS
jgi:transcriptional regulator with PAS, ATPase and Fis domain